ncbi:MAG: RCC1 domain-containing protein, partial [Acidimicrobiaceae bacterium]|nr:RCC1 domain-containing protein [Acidimicrobiaceae bacterium]
ALDGSGRITCWGRNEYGELDAPGGSYVAVSVGGDHSCALDDSGSIICWGDTTYPYPPLVATTN